MLGCAALSSKAAHPPCPTGRLFFVCSNHLFAALFIAAHSTFASLVCVLLCTSWYRVLMTYLAGGCGPFFCRTFRWSCTTLGLLMHRFTTMRTSIYIRTMGTSTNLAGGRGPFTAVLLCRAALSEVSFLLSPVPHAGFFAAAMPDLHLSPRTYRTTTCAFLHASGTSFCGPLRPLPLAVAVARQQVCFTVDVVFAVCSLVSSMYFLSMQP